MQNRDPFDVGDPKQKCHPVQEWWPDTKYVTSSNIVGPYLMWPQSKEWPHPIMLTHFKYSSHHVLVISNKNVTPYRSTGHIRKYCPILCLGPDTHAFHMAFTSNVLLLLAQCYFYRYQFTKGQLCNKKYQPSSVIEMSRYWSNSKWYSQYWRSSTADTRELVLQVLKSWYCRYWRTGTADTDELVLQILKNWYCRHRGTGTVDTIELVLQILKCKYSRHWNVSPRIHFNTSQCYCSKTKWIVTS